ncbi:hypothetical protein T484DRAFT_1769484 [Baffinella frigidus]|nr:hypothetical protein T484DRAFT_1769484 [Cryptophyta sp. CCMP2293]|mmetsp:Transcript_29034/g.69279  ORF Transcript_29034/g.69279 Transcript_29034/m.69279 type:complete len:135 (-) Transcript_29034:581-985(-)
MGGAAPRRAGVAWLGVLALCGLAEGFMPSSPSLQSMGTVIPASRTCVIRPRIRAATHAYAMRMDLATVAGFGGLLSLAYVGQLANPSRTELGSDPYAALQGVELQHAPDGRLVPITSAWSADERAVVVCLRSFG